MRSSGCVLIRFQIGKVKERFGICWVQHQRFGINLYAKIQISIFDKTECGLRGSRFIHFHDIFRAVFGLPLSKSVCICIIGWSDVMILKQTLALRSFNESDL